MKNGIALEVKDVYKSFFENPVLRGVSFKVECGSILGLLGGNGAGKSTLMKIVNGIYSMDSGEIHIDGEVVNIRNAQDAKNIGIAMVYQELSLVPTLTVLQNLFLNCEPTKGIQIDDKASLKKAQQIIDSFGIEDIDLNAITGDLPIGKQQVVEILKALLKDVKVLILDEPTASLSRTEIVLLFDFLNKLKAQGIAIIFITHNMQEIIDICDSAVILRNGIVALDDEVKNLDIQLMVEAMLGRKHKELSIVRKHKANYDISPVLNVKSLFSKDGRVKGVDLEVYSGEVVGIAGLMGSGRTELLKCLLGLQAISSGTIHMNEIDITNCKPWNAIKNGLFIIPEDRRKTGIIDIHSVLMNLFIPTWHKFTRFLTINDKNSKNEAKDIVGKLDVVSTSIEQELRYLSGGNQQKVVIGKGIYTNPTILLMDEPTVGVDVETKDSISKIIATIADTGKSVLLISSEFSQLLKVCDRILIMQDGSINKEIVGPLFNLTEQELTMMVQNSSTD